MGKEERWPRVRLKYLATVNDETLTDSTLPEYELAYLDIGSVDSAGTVGEPETQTFEKAPSRARRVARDGDVIISTVRTYLTAIAPIEDAPDNLVVSTGFAVVRPRPGELDPHFCKYALRDPHFIDEVKRLSVGVNYPAINVSDLVGIEIPRPPLPEQRAIAARLDRETARLDALAAEYRQLVAGLAEKRRALVAHAVTRGLDPDAPTKDSGVEWLGEVPAHWPLVRLRYLARLGNGSTPSKSRKDYWLDGDIPWLSSTVVNSDVVTEPSAYVTDIAFEECHLPWVPARSVLVAITGQGKTRGMAAVLSFDATINQHIAFLAPKPDKVSTEYLWLSLTGLYEALRYVSDSQGGTRGAITLDQLGGFSIPVPPLDEQTEIAAHVERRSAALASLTAEAERALALLAARRGALIAEAVSGHTARESSPTTA